jgi:sec-independent protein translocase protein TatC
MSDTPSNGQPEEPIIPRIAAPEGQRAARGQFPPEEGSEAEETPGDVPEASTELSVVDAPSVEDSYLPPVDLDPETPPSLWGKSKNPDTPKDTEQGLFEHLAELRKRILNCFLILFFGMLVTWKYSIPLQDWFKAPIIEVLKGRGKIQSLDPAEFLTMTIQVSLISAVILTSPLIFWQIWRFIEPALTKEERRYTVVLVPFASILFIMGVALGYSVSPLFYKFFLAFQPAGVEANWGYTTTVVLMAKMLLVFGVMFEVPVVIIFLNKLGILTRNVLIEYWRHAVVVIFVVVAVLTPTWDPFTLVVCATPPCLLYVLSIWLVKWL